ncbi:MAG: SulP family inorganic anion transporter, partial [Gammaproteobacteria bacterium]
MEKALWRRYKFDLGIHTLLPEWRNLFNKKTILNDVMAGITVACVAIPLTLAIGLASGVTPEASIITAIVTGIVCALFGGTTLTVSGPAAAMSILLASIVETHGMSGLIIMTLLAGFMQLLSGIFGLGKFTRFVPIPVIAGFTAGIGLIILVGQLPRAFGLPPPEQSHIFFVFSHLIQYSENINFVPLFIVALTLVIMRTWSKITTKIPAPLMAVIVPTLLVNILPMGHLETIGEIPRYLPPIVIPQLPSNLNWMELFAGAFTIYLLASLETLLSANAVDKITKEHEHDSNQELVGQGLGNMAVSLVGGIAVTGVIARSVTNIAAGAKTRLSSIVHSLVILATVFALAPFMSQIPIAVLAGVLFYIALSMINVKEFLDYWRTSKTEGGIYGATFLVIVLVDLIAGVQVGIAAAMLIVLLRLAKTNLHFSSQTYDNIIRLSLDGNINFLSANKISELKSQFGDLKKNQYVILDLSRVNDMDSSGSESIVDLINRYHGTHLHFFIKGLPKRFETLFELFGGKNFLEPL